MVNRHIFFLEIIINYIEVYFVNVKKYILFGLDLNTCFSFPDRMNKVAIFFVSRSQGAANDTSSQQPFIITYLRTVRLNSVQTAEHYTVTICLYFF